jgi:DNA repair protein SbcD/Mre11
MKIIHLADLHIGTQFINMPDNIKEELGTKLRNVFRNIIEYAKSNGIDTILMSGDVFDKNAVPLGDKKYFYDLIRINPSIDFYYIKGNHDRASKYSEEIENLHSFEGVQSYIKGETRIIGYELGEDNSVLYDYHPFTTDKYNILMLHGDIANARDKDYIDLKRLLGKNIDYFALGHIHKTEEGFAGEGKYAYPGCAMGRGFDETGKKGFLVLDTTNNSTAFVSVSEIEFEHIEIAMNSLNEASLKKEISEALGKKDEAKITEIKLIGRADFVPDADDLMRTFSSARHYLCVKNASKMALSYQKSEKENSLKNMFINKVLSDPNLDEDSKQKVIAYGLSKLMKEEI